MLRNPPIFSPSSKSVHFKARPMIMIPIRTIYHRQRDPWPHNAFAYSQARQMYHVNNISRKDLHLKFESSYAPYTFPGSFRTFRRAQSSDRIPSPLETSFVSPHSPPSSQTSKKLFSCLQCSYETDRKNNLKRHIITMHFECSRKLECCGMQFRSKATIREHVNTCHKNGYSCATCGRVFCRKALLRRHWTVHSGLKEFQCSSCNYATSHKSNLERHQRVHCRDVTCAINDCDVTSGEKLWPKYLRGDTKSYHNGVTLETDICKESGGSDRINNNVSVYPDKNADGVTFNTQVVARMESSSTETGTMAQLLRSNITTSDTDMLLSASKDADPVRQSLDKSTHKILNGKMAPANYNETDGHLNVHKQSTSTGLDSNSRCVTPIYFRETSPDQSTENISNTDISTSEPIDTGDKNIHTDMNADNEMEANSHESDWPSSTNHLNDCETAKQYGETQTRQLSTLSDTRHSEDVCSRKSWIVTSKTEGQVRARLCPLPYMCPRCGSRFKDQFLKESHVNGPECRPMPDLIEHSCSIVVRKLTTQSGLSV